MSWNYRVTYRPKNPLEGYAIREVYYTEEGEVKFYSRDPITAYGDISDELYADMCMMMDAFDKEPLNLDNVDYELGITY